MTNTSTAPSTVFDQTDAPAIQGGVDGKPAAFASLVGDDKKFKTPDDLAKAKLESDAFIERLKTENANMRKELELATKVDEALEEITRKARNQPSGDGQPALDPTDLAELVRKEIQQTNKTEQASRNLLEADAFLTEKFGGKEEAKKVLTEKARELGMSVSWLIDVAKTNPKALYNVLGLQVNTQPPAAGVKSMPGTGNVNTDKKEFAPSGGAPKPDSYAYYEAIRKSNPAEYFSPRIQNAIHKANAEGKYFTQQ